MSRPSSISERQNLGVARLIEEATALGIEVSGDSETAIEAAISAEKTRRWQEENREAIASWNDYVRRNGLPLAKYRLF